MPLTGKQMLKKALKAGWIEIRIKGSHHHGNKDGKTIAIPVHGNTDLKKGMEQKLLKDLGL